MVDDVVAACELSSLFGWAWFVVDRKSSNEWETSEVRGPWSTMGGEGVRSFCVGWEEGADLLEVGALGGFHSTWWVGWSKGDVFEGGFLFDILDSTELVRESYGDRG